MAELEIKVTDIVPEFVQIATKGTRPDAVMAHTAGAISRIAEMYQEAWIRAAGGHALPGLPFVIHSRGGYASSIRINHISDNIKEIFSDYTTKAGYGLTSMLEAGHGPIDLKPGLLGGPKARQGKKGPYNIVSFRHGIPGTGRANNPMPLSVHRSMQQDTSRATSVRKAASTPIQGASRVSRSSAQPGGRAYQWGAKFDQQSQRGRRSKIVREAGKTLGTYTWKKGKYAGMVRMQASTGTAKSSQYMTFRVVSAASDPMSWIVPEQPPWPVRDAVKEFVQPFAEGILQEKLEADLG